MKAKPLKFNGIDTYDPCNPKDATHIQMALPCGCRHLMLPVLVGNKARFGTPNWSWNGDTEKPTVRPSVLTHGHNFTCHSWINDGVMQFLPDTTGIGHESLGGKNVPLLEIEP